MTTFDAHPVAVPGPKAADMGKHDALQIRRSPQGLRYLLALSVVKPLATLHVEIVEVRIAG